MARFIIEVPDRMAKNVESGLSFFLQPVKERLYANETAALLHEVDAFGPNVKNLGIVRINSCKKDDGSEVNITIDIKGEPEYVSEKYSEFSAKINHGKL